MATIVFNEHFHEGDFSNYTLQTGSWDSFSIVEDDYGNALKVEPGPVGLDVIQRIIASAPFEKISVKFKVTSTGTDDYGRCRLFDASDNLIVDFNAGRQASIDSLRRPNILFTTAVSAGGNPIGSGSVTLDRWYEFRSSFDPDTNIFSCSVVDLTNDTVFGSVSVEVTERPPVSKIQFSTEDQQTSGSTVLWDDLVIERAAEHFGSVGYAVFFRLNTDPPLRLWCGVNDVPIGLDVIDEAGSIYLGAGKILNVPELEVLINGTADSVDISLPGVSVEASNRVVKDAPKIQGLSVNIGLAYLDERYQPLTSIIPVWFGRADIFTLNQDVVDNPGSQPTRTLILSVSSGMSSRSRPRRTSYTDTQQKLLYPTDQFCSRVSRYTQLYEVEWPIF